MFLYDYDAEKHMEMQRKEWREIGWEEGNEAGKAAATMDGIRILVSFCHNLGQSYEEASRSVSEQYHLSKEETEDIMKQNWPAL